MQQLFNVDPILVHTGQHFDASMSSEIIAALELPVADLHLDVGPGSQAWQIATIMTRLETIYKEIQPDCTVVVGDVNSTLAAALVSEILDVPVAHVEAGLRSFNPTMPEERNRALTDRLSRWLFAPSTDAVDNLRNEGMPESRIQLVGNVMIDSLDWILPRVDIADVLQRHHVVRNEFGIVTLHRPSNVDNQAVLLGMVRALSEISRDHKLLFAVHPRTRKRFEEWNVQLPDRLQLMPPVAYPDFVALMSAAAIVLTDSGGIQEEALVLGIPCLTLREETERPITLTNGRNEIVGTDPNVIVRTAFEKFAHAPGWRGEPFRPPLWDGHTAERIVEVLVADSVFQ